MIRTTTTVGIFLVGTILLCGATPQARGRDDGIIYNPARGGDVTTLQGEYSPYSNSRTVGAPVIARGRGRYDVIFLPGGLPGEGWDGVNRIKCDGYSSGPQMSIRGKRWKVSITDGKLSGKDENGKFVSLRKTSRISSTNKAKKPSRGITLFNGRSTGQWTENASVGRISWPCPSSFATQALGSPSTGSSRSTPPCTGRFG